MVDVLWDLGGLSAACGAGYQGYLIVCDGRHDLLPVSEGRQSPTRIILGKRQGWVGGWAVGWAGCCEGAGGADCGFDRGRGVGEATREDKRSELEIMIHELLPLKSLWLSLWHSHVA